MESTESDIDIAVQQAVNGRSGPRRKSLDNVRGLRLSSTENVRKTRSRLLRLLVAEDESTVDLAYWKMILAQLDALRNDFKVEGELNLNERLDALEDNFETMKRARGL